MYQTGGTIKQALDAVGKHDYVLPAIQREFVWKPDQIARLFDSIMQGYPFGTFLLWRIEPENSSKFRFYDFVRDYHERDQPHCPALPVQHDRGLIAVLDGQQRLTALNIGLRGSMAWKLPNKWWTNPDAFPTRRLHLDLLAAPDEEEPGERYRFQFLTDEQAANPAPGECWFRVGAILGMESGPDMLAWLNGRLPQDQLTPAYRVLDLLYRVVHNQTLVAYYEEKSQDLDKVLNIFIRTNSGGTILSYSDLLLSVAVAQWSRLDAREEIHSLVDDINRIGDGFDFSKDLVLKAGLMLSDIGNVGFKVENFNRQNMELLEDNWSAVKRSITLAVRLLSSFGFSGQNLRADSAILPIAYYLYLRDPGESYLTHSDYQEDRAAVHEWLIRSLLKASGIWGSGLDTLLTALREVIKEQGANSFPAARIREVMTRRGKSLAFEEEEIDELVDISYGDKRTFALLSLLFPFVDLRYHFHIDHVFPQARFTAPRLRKAGVPDDQIDDFQTLSNRLPNLQLLEGAFNNEKRQKLPSDWLAERYPSVGDRADYCSKHLLGSVPADINDFRAFYDHRRDRLKTRIREVLAVPGRAS